MAKAIIIGYGNVDREDDGVAWHVLQKLAGRLGNVPDPGDEDEPTFLPGENADLLFVLQLTPELGEQIAQYERVCFIDAHTGAVPSEIQFIPIQPELQRSPLTHHMTPQTCLAISSMLYGKQPAGYLLSIRGYQFGFSSSLSERTAVLAEEAVEKVVSWLARTNDTV